MNIASKCALCLAVLVAVAQIDLTEGKIKKARSAAEWDKIMKEEEERLFKEEQEEREARKPQMPEMTPDAMNKPGAVEQMMAAQKGGKTAMIFVTVLVEGGKPATEKLSGKFRGILKEANGLDASPYVIEDDKMLFVLQDGHHGQKLITILLTFPEVAEVEWDQVKTPGKAKAAYEKKNPPKKEASKDDPPKGTHKEL